MSTLCRWLLPAAFALCGQVWAAQVGPDVASALADQRNVRVLVSFAGPAARSADPEVVGAHADRLTIAAMAAGAVIERRFISVPAMALTLDARALAELRDSPDIDRIDLDVGGSGSLLQSRPLANVDAVNALGFNGAGVKIAIIDSGIRLDHQSFAGRVVAEACFCTTCCPNGQATQIGTGAGANSHPHGTNVAGIALGGTSVSGVPAGVAPAASIISVRVLDANNNFCCTSDVIAALDWVRTNHPDTRVVNMSLGTNALFAGHCDGAASFTQTFAATISALVSGGTSVVASSMNNASSTQMGAPACIQQTLSVGAVWDANVGTQALGICTDSSTQADLVSCYANLSTTTDMLAPGGLVTAAGTGSPTGTSTFTGTSMAAPMVAGCIGLLEQAVPAATPQMIEAALKASPTRLLRPPMVQDYPRLDCLHALSLLGGLFANGFE